MAETAPSIIYAGGDQSQRETVRRSLRAAHYQLREIATAAEALAAARAEAAILILDSRLQDAGGLAVCRRLKEDPAAAAAPVLYLADEHDEGAAEVADAFLCKPVREAELLAAVRTLSRLLAERQAHATAAAEYQALLDSLDLGVCLVDRQAVMRQGNQGWAALAGRPQEALLGKPIDLLADAPALAGTSDLWRRLAHATRRETADCCRGERWFRLTATPVRDADGAIQATALLCEPVTAASRSEPAAEPTQGERLERELSALEQMARPPHSVRVTAAAFGSVPLREQVPALFEKMVTHYENLLDMAVEQRNYQVSHHLSDQLRALGEQLGFVGAGPRDVVEIHNEALKRKRRGQRVEKGQVYVEEGRFLVLELMGHLVSRYRRYSLGAARTRDASRPTPGQ